MAAAERAEKLRKDCGHRRIDLGLSIRDAATAIGVPAASLHRFEQGRGDPRLSFVVKVMAWLEATAPAKET